MARQEYLSCYYKEIRRLIQLLVTLQVLRKASQFTFYCNQTQTDSNDIKLFAASASQSQTSIYFDLYPKTKNLGM